MLGEERRQYLLDTINKTGSINARQIAEALDVSEATIRRDLNKLCKKNLVKRTYGGALKVLSVGQEMKFNAQKEKYIAEKKKIGMAAAQLLKERDVVIIESGTTGYQTALHIHNKEELTVITNSCEIALALSAHHPSFTIMVSGGILDTQTHSLVGPIADHAFSNLNVDKAFIGITGLDIDKGITAVNPIETTTKKNMIGSAKKIIALADHSKLGHISVNAVADVSVIDVLITDERADKKFVSRLKNLGITVIQPT